MLVTFRSKAAGEIYMYLEHARILLEIMGKDIDPPTAPRGVVTVEQLPAALERLRTAAARSAEADRQARESYEADEGPKDALTMPVGMAQRAHPLIEMLERAQKKGVVVTWGV